MRLTILNKKTTPKEIKDLYVNKKRSIRMLAKYYETNRNTIKKHLTKQNIPIRTERPLLLDNFTTPEEIRRLYWDELLSTLEIAKKFNLPSHKAVKNYLKRHHIPIRSRLEAFRNYKRKTPSFLRNIGPQTLELIRKLHWQDKKSLPEIIKILNLNISLNQFIRALKAHFIPYRTSQETRKLRNILKKDRKHSLNENFFSTWSPEMAYVLGWIYSDGCIDNGDRIRMATKDKYILENIRELLKSTHKIGINKRTKVHQLELKSREIYSDLLGYGLHPNKSLSIEFPSVPSGLLRHFVRGVFEGDGSVWIERFSSELRTPSLSTCFCSGSRKFLGGLNEAINKNTNLPLKNIIPKTDKRRPDSSGAWEIKYAKYDSYELSNFMYKDVPKNMILNRKYEKFYNFFLPMINIGDKLIEIIESLSKTKGIIYIKEITDSYNEIANVIDRISYLEASNILKVLGFDNRGRNSQRGIYLKIN
ncbi:hypothetical protein MYX76_03515 [Desulfobacterota bacterium AH_259_B03_O07]|nr:hypothetical protein [Desulfobacterota bacterium AH_259_B03_O07]